MILRCRGFAPHSTDHKTAMRLDELTLTDIGDEPNEDFAFEQYDDDRADDDERDDDDCEPTDLELESMREHHEWFESLPLREQADELTKGASQAGADNEYVVAGRYVVEKRNARRAALDWRRRRLRKVIRPYMRSRGRAPSSTCGRASRSTRSSRDGPSRPDDDERPDVARQLGVAA